MFIRFLLSAVVLAMCLLSTAEAQDSESKPGKAANMAGTVTPACGSLVGYWVNQMGSLMNIKGVDSTTGSIAGEYMTSTGAGGWHPLSGWVNNDTGSLTTSEMNTPSQSKIVSFAVKWKGIGRITSWTGFCLGDSDLRTNWHLGAPFTYFDWDHMLTGADTFHPVNAAQAQALIKKHEADASNKKSK